MTRPTDTDTSVDKLINMGEFGSIEWTYGQVDIDLINPGRYQPRRDFPRDSLVELGKSMRVTSGNVQPVALWKLDNGSFELVAGERRWRAAQLAGLPQVNAIWARLSSRQAMIIAMVENLQREDLNPMEEAEGFERLNKEGGLTHQEIAESTGKSRAVITNAIRLTTLHIRVKDLIRRRQLSAAAGRTIAALENREDQKVMANLAHKSRWDVRRLEAEVAKKKSGKIKPVRETKSRDLQRLEDTISERSGYPANVDVSTSGRVKLSFSFADNRGLQAFLEQQGFVPEE